MQLNDALKLISSSRKPILFLGAGFANDATNLLDRKTPSSRQLVESALMEFEIDGDGNTPLSFVIDQIAENSTPQQSFEFIRNNLTVADATVEQLRILSLPWRRIYTTNIDNIGVDFSKRRCIDATTDSSPSDAGDFVYLHGCLANCSPTNFYQKVKMGEQLYVANSHSQSLYHGLLQQDLYEADCVIVIGYSISDPDLAHIFYQSDDLINKFFVFSGNTKPLEHHRISMIGMDTKQRSTDFLSAFESLPPSSDQVFSPYVEFDVGGYEKKPISQLARQGLLVFGRFDRNVARSSWSVSGSPTYVVPRTIAEEIAKLPLGTTAVVHSSLGNGKSLILEYLRFIASQGQHLFIIDESATLEQLRSGLIEIPIGSTVIFEGNIFFASDVQEIVSTRSIKLVTSSRTTTLRVSAKQLYSHAKSNVRIYDANQLNDLELADFHDLIETMGFWPAELASRRTTDRIDELKTKYDRSVCAILVKIFENTNIREEIRTRWQESRSSLAPVYDHFIVASYMDMIDLSCPPYLIRQFQSADYSELANSENDIIDVDRYGITRFHNTIVGEFIFANFIEKEEIIGSIVRFCNFIDSHVSQRRYQWIVRRMLRYWNLSQVLSSKTLPEKVFDRSSYIPSVSSDPLFWVQYSIAKMENGEYLPAERFVTTAYAKARARTEKFDTYQIDTHAARLTIRKILDNGIGEGFAAEVNNALGLLRSVVERRPDDIYHISSVVTNLLTSGIKFSYEMKEKEYGTFRHNLISIGDKITNVDHLDFTFAPERQARDLINKLR